MLIVVVARSGGQLAAAEPPPDRTLRDIVSALRTGDDNHRLMAVQAVRGLSPERRAALRPLLIKVLFDTKATVAARAAAANGLVDTRLTGAAEVAALLGVTSDRAQPEPLRESLADTLLKLASQRPVDLAGHHACDALVPLISSPKEATPLRETATAVLSAVPREVGENELRTLVSVYQNKGQPPSVRGGVLMILASMGSAARPALPIIKAVTADRADDGKLRETSLLVAARIAGAQPEKPAPSP